VNNPKFRRPKATPFLTQTDILRCTKYLATHNKSAAYKAGGFNGKKTSLGEVAKQYFNRAHIKAYVDKQLVDQSDRTNVSIERTLMELGKIAYSNEGDYWESWDVTGGKIKSKDELTKDQLAAISGVSFEPGMFGIKARIHLHSKNEALKILMDHFHLVKDPKGKEEDNMEKARSIKRYLIEIGEMKPKLPKDEE